MASLSLYTHYALFLLLLCFLNSSFAAQEDPVINTSHGRVQGKLLSVLGGYVRAFLGIPYAKPPIGKLRFRPPELAEKWDNVRDATAFPNTCCQIPDTVFPGFKGAEMWNPNTPLSEDCLYLNVWAPHVNKSKAQPPPLAPVLVWIYGGGFTMGTSSLDIYDGRFLSKSENVVVVSMNYRLGAFGFLSFPNNNIQGNAGLLDQQLALRWVADNIAKFGGDPSKVTIFGESAGSASVGFHLLSPGSSDLFQRAVLQSASPNAPWATLSQTKAWNRSRRLAQSLGCPLSPEANLEACLQKANADDIVTKQNDVILEPALISIPFAPIIDGDFLPQSIEELLSSSNPSNKEVLFGLNRDEGTYFLPYGLPGFNNTGQSLITRKEFLEGIPIAMDNVVDAIKQAVIFQYTDWTDESNRMKNRDFMGSLVGDQQFVCPVLEFAQWYSQGGAKTFLYWFDHRSSVNSWPEWMGAMHGYEIEFVFGMPLNASLGYTKNEVNMTKKFMKHWANFARTGNPSIDGAPWPIFTPEKREYVTLNYNPPELRRNLRPKECHLWNTLIQKIQMVADDLTACRTSNGNILHFSFASLLVLVVIALTFK